MAKILIVEDEHAMRMGLRDNLEFEGYTVEEAADGEAGLAMITKTAYDLALVDVMMPKLSGFDLCRQARAAGVQTPIIILTAKAEEIDTVLGLELGADDYITKPFSLRELLARIKAQLRRNSQAKPADSHGAAYTIGLLGVDFSTFTARRDGQAVSMTHLEMEVLRYLIDHAHETVPRTHLLENVWGYEQQPTTRTVDNFILKLRQKIEPEPAQPRHILTVHGIGYKLVM